MRTSLWVPRWTLLIERPDKGEEACEGVRQEGAIVSTVSQEAKLVRKPWC